MLNKLMNLVKDEEGATALEYGLLAALIAAVIIGTVTTLGQTINTKMTEIDTKMNAS